MKLNSHNNSNKLNMDDDVTRDVSTAVMKFCKISPKLRLWRSRFRFVRWLDTWVYSGNMSLVKEMMNYCTRLVLETRSPNPLPCRRIPRMLRALIRIGRSGEAEKNSVISIFSVYRLYTLKPDNSVTSVTGEFSGLWPDEKLSSFFKAARTFLGPEFKQGLEGAFEWHKPWSAGPNGRPGWAFTYEDVSTLFQTKLGDYILYFLKVFPLKHRDELILDIRRMLSFVSERRWIKNRRGFTLTGTAESQRKQRLMAMNAVKRLQSFQHNLKKISWYRPLHLWDTLLDQSSLAVKDNLIPEWMEEMENALTGIYSGGFTFEKAYRILSSLEVAKAPKAFEHSKLHFLSDKGGKTRVIAMGDIVTHTLVKPIHKFIFRVLKSHPCDGTFDQEGQRQRVREATKYKLLYSIDMKSCTDRLPAVFQMACISLSGLLSKRQSLAWYLLLTKRVFRRGRLRHYVSYRVGQPMGILSSWAVMAYSHHILVKWAALSQGLESFDEYAILGDDVVIWNSIVATSYLDILRKLGVEVSSSKSFSEVGLAEFAKAFYKRTADLKPISPDLMRNRRDFLPACLVETAQQLSSKQLRLLPWLLDTFSRVSMIDVSTLLVNNNVQFFVTDNIIVGDVERLMASILDFNKTLDKSVDQDDVTSYQALHRYFYPAELIPSSSLSVGALCWGVMPKIGPAWEIYGEFKEFTAFLWLPEGSDYVKIGELRIVLGDNWIAWDPDAWGFVENPLNYIESRSLDQVKLRRDKYYPYRIAGSSLSEIISKKFGYMISPFILSGIVNDPWAGTVKTQTYSPRDFRRY